MGRDSFILYMEHQVIFETLTDEQAGQLMKIIFEYEKTNEVPEMNQILKLAFTPIKQVLDKNKEKYEKVIERNKNNINKRWNTKNTTGKTGINSNTKNTDNDNEYDNDNDNVSATADIKGDGCADGSKQFDSCVDGIVKFYEENIGTISPHAYEVLNSYRENFSDDVIIYALQLSVEANAKGINYTKAILNNWQKANVKTLIDAQNENSRRKSSVSNSSQVANLYHEEYGDLSKFYI